MDAGINTVGEGEIYDSVFTAKRDGWFAMPGSKLIQSCTATTGHDHGKRFPDHAVDRAPFNSFFHLPVLLS